MRQINVTDYFREGEKLFGTDRAKWQFICPNCGNVQTKEDFIRNNIPEPETKVHFSCIGRWLEKAKGTIFNKEKPCNYTAGGLFKLDGLLIVFEEEKGYEKMIFDFYRGGQGNENS
jgi:hypothetical protein